MIPRDTRKNSYVRVIPKELGPQIQRTRQILITLKNSVLGSVGETYHPLKTLYLCAYHVVGFDAKAVEHIKNHRGGGRLAVRTAYHDTDLVFGLLVQVLGEGVYLQPQLARTH